MQVFTRAVSAGLLGSAALLSIALTVVFAPVLLLSGVLLLPFEGLLEQAGY